MRSCRRPLVLELMCNERIVSVLCDMTDGRAHGALLLLAKLPIVSKCLHASSKFCALRTQLTAIGFVRICLHERMSVFVQQHLRQFVLSASLSRIPFNTDAAGHYRRMRAMPADADTVTRTAWIRDTPPQVAILGSYALWAHLVLNAKCPTWVPNDVDVYYVWSGTSAYCEAKGLLETHSWWADADMYYAQAPGFGTPAPAALASSDFGCLRVTDYRPHIVSAEAMKNGSYCGGSPEYACTAHMGAECRSASLSAFVDSMVMWLHDIHRRFGIVAYIIVPSCDRDHALCQCYHDINSAMPRDEPAPHVYGGTPRDTSVTSLMLESPPPNFTAAQYLSLVSGHNQAEETADNRQPFGPVPPLEHSLKRLMDLGYDMEMGFSTSTSEGGYYHHAITYRLAVGPAPFFLLAARGRPRDPEIEFVVPEIQFVLPRADLGANATLRRVGTNFDIDVCDVMCTVSSDGVHRTLPQGVSYGDVSRRRACVRQRSASVLTDTGGVRTAKRVAKYEERGFTFFF